MSETTYRKRATSTWLDLPGGRHHARMRVAVTTAGWVVIILLASIFGAVLYAAGAFRSLSGGGGTGGFVGPCSASGSFPITGQVSDAITGTALGATTTIDIIVPATNGWTKAAESPTQSSSAYTSKNNYPACTTFYLHVSSSAGNRYYDGLFGPYVAGTGSFTLGSTTSCNACVWSQQAGIIGLYQESTGANVKFTIIDPSGTTCGTATGAAAGTYAADTNALGASTLLFTLTIQLAGSTSTNPTAFGVPEPYINAANAPPGAPGPGTNMLQLVAWLGINMTGGQAWVVQNGWTQTTVQPVAGMTLYYKLLPAIVSTRTQGATYSTTLPIDKTGIAAGKYRSLELWVSDNQLPGDAALASPDGAPSAFGAYSVVGPNAQVFATASFASGSVATAGAFATPMAGCGVKT